MANASVAETSGQEWVGAVIDVAVTVGDGDDAFQPQTIVWLDAASGAVVGTELCRPGELEAHAAASLLAATRAPKEGAPRIPGRVRVETSELADALRGRIGEIEVVVGPVPELAPVAASLRDFLEGDREELTLLGDDMAPEVVERFFTAAARLHRLAPWKRVPTDCFFAVRCKALGIEAGALCVVGQMGQAFGFALFRTEQDAADYLDEIEESSERGEEPELPQHIMVDYDADPPPTIAAEVKEHGWPTDEGMVPTAMMVAGPGMMRPLHADELVAVTAVVDALATVIETERKVERAWEDDDAAFTHSLRVDVLGSTHDVTLSAPLWLPLPDDLEDDELDGYEEDEERAAVYLGELTAGGKVAPELLAWADMLTHYAMDYLGGLVHELRPNQLSELLFRVVPRKVSCEPEDAPELIATVRAMLDEAATRPAPDGDNARRLLAWLPRDASQRIARELADPRNFGMAKSFVMAGKQAGFDMTTEAGMQAYLALTNGRPPVLRAPMPAAQKASLKQAKAKAKAGAKKAAKARKQTKKARKRSKR